MLPSEIQNELATMLWQSTGHEGKISDLKTLGGGSINDCCRFTYNTQHWFVKWNDRSKYPGMFAAERKGLEMLRSKNSISTPKVVGEGETNNFAFLLMMYVQQKATDASFWIRFGIQLSELHRNTSNSFGLDHNNYIGSLVQTNNSQQSWSAFFAEMRLLPQARLAVANGRASKALIQKFELLSGKLEHLFPNEPPSLLHGDLWSGNFLCNSNADPVLIDPAVYYGHREMDIAMTMLFGGFGGVFYDAYNSTYPLVAGWKERTDLCNLYPLLVHVNLFGGGYLSQVEQILRRYL